MEAFLIIIIIAIPTFFISKFIVNRLSLGQVQRRNFLSLIITFCLSPLIYLGLVYAFIFSTSYYSKKDYDKNAWHSTVEKRYEMSTDIIKSEMLIGMTQEEVVNELGPKFYNGGEHYVIYHLGFLPGPFNIDPDGLYIYFEDGKVVRVEQHES